MTLLDHLILFALFLFTVEVLFLFNNNFNEEAKRIRENTTNVRKYKTNKVSLFSNLKKKIEVLGTSK